MARETLSPFKSFKELLSNRGPILSHFGFFGPRFSTAGSDLVLFRTHSDIPRRFPLRLFLIYVSLLAQTISPPFSMHI
jgi:hypothetical protein